jgi:hypothetical protein
MGVNHIDVGSCPIVCFIISNNEPLSSTNTDVVVYLFTSLLQDQEETELGF